MSTPTNQLSFTMPPNACNAHLHIIDPAFPNDGHAAAQIGTVDAYRQLARDLNLPRAVFVQAKPFALDNTWMRLLGSARKMPAVLRLWIIR